MLLRLVSFRQLSLADRLAQFQRESSHIKIQSNRAPQTAVEMRLLPIRLCLRSFRVAESLAADALSKSVGRGLTDRRLIQEVFGSVRRTDSPNSTADSNVSGFGTNEVAPCGDYRQRTVPAITSIELSNTRLVGSGITGILISPTPCSVPVMSRTKSKPLTENGNSVFWSSFVTVTL